LNNPPELISPVNSASGIDLTTTLDWSDISNFEYYQIQISTNSLFEYIIFDSNLTSGSSFNLPTLVLDGNTEYYWKVRVKSNSGLSNFSNYFKFRTKIALPRSWAFKPNTGKNSTVYVHKSIFPKIGNRNIVSGDVIGLFYTLDNIDYCAGYGTWTGNNLFITVWGDDILTLNKDGFYNNEIYKYKMWDCQEDKVYRAIAGYASGPDNFQNNTTTILNSLYSTEKNIKLDLKSGWNMISANVNPETKLMDSIWSSINHLLVIAKNNNGDTYIPEYNINGIGDWDYKQGYQVYLTNDTILSITGAVLKPENEIIPLYQGWNLVSYLRSTALDATTALETLIIDDKLVIAKNNSGNVYIPQFDINTIGDLIPGQGYMVCLLSNDALVYPKESIEKRTLTLNYQNYTAQILNYEPASKEQNMTLIIEFKNANDFSEIAVFDKNNNIRGSSKIIENKAVLTIWNDINDKNFDELQIKGLNNKGFLIDLELAEIVDLECNIKYSKLKYCNNALFHGKINYQREMNNFNFNINPNPLRDEAKVEFVLFEDNSVDLVLYDLTGKVIKSLKIQKLKKGNNSVLLNSEGLSCGNYLLILKIDTVIITQILSIIK
jgi:hypothetical protein